jgi:hypothetical protein
MKPDLPYSNFFSHAQKHSDDAITQRRHEIKFEYLNTDISKIDSILQTNCQRVIHASDESVVNSIYFDDDSLTSLRQNLYGIGSRIKLRLRWYDSKLPEKHAFFEVKRKANTIVEKERYAIISKQPLNRLSYTEIINELLRVLPETPRELLRMRQQPIVLIKYYRKHFKARNATLPIRVTLDHRIEGFEQIGSKMPSMKFSAPLYDRIVLEAKSTIGKENRIPKLLYPLRPRQSRFSKYVLTCSQLGLITGISEHFI